MGKSRKSSEGLARQKVAGFVALGLLAIGALGVSAAALMRPAPEASSSASFTPDEDNLANLRLYTEGSNFETIDIHKAFVDYGDFASLYKDNVHPAGAEGYRIWADVVIAAMKG